MRTNLTKLLRRLATRISNRTIDPFPVWNVVRSYRPSQARSDLVASLNVALLAFPQGMAYAMIAGLPIEYGLFGSAIATIVGPLFSGSRFIVLGPTNATSVLLFSTFLALGIPESDRGALLPVLLWPVLDRLPWLIASALAGVAVANVVQIAQLLELAGFATDAPFTHHLRSDWPRSQETETLLPPGDR